MGRTEKETDQLKRSFFIVPEAETEVQEAFAWYEQQSVGLGHEFLRAADTCVSSIQRNPLAYPTAHGQTRRALLRKFPYALFYLIDGDRIVVLACFHLRRQPLDWLRRAK